MARLDKEKDVARSEENFAESGGGSRTLKIPDGKTPIYILSPDYADGFIHWIHLVDGTNLRVVCAGGLEGKGFAPTECALCKKVVDIYKEAKSAEKAGKKAEATGIRKQGNDLRAKYSAEFVAAKGEIVWEKDKATGKKTPAPDFDEAEVGVINFTQKQYRDLISLRGSPQYPFIKTGADLLNRVILLDKGDHDSSGKGGSKKQSFSTIVFIPSKRVSDPPVEFEPSEYKLEEDFEIDTDQIDEALGLLDGDYEEVELEDDDEDEAPPAKKKTAAAAKKGKASSKVSEDEEESDDSDEAAEEADDFLSEDSDDGDNDFATDDGFEDDDPEEDFKKQQAAKKKGKKR